MRRLAASLMAGLVCAAVASAQGSDERSRAREASARRDWPTALQLFERLVERHPQDVDLLIEAARVQGFADRNAEAARLYRQALAAAPGRRADIVPSLAWQSLWSGEAAQALALFDERLAALSGPARAEWLDGLAQARQALGDQAGALQAYREADALSPGQKRLQQRLALSWLWNGHEARATELLQELARRHPQDREIAWSLANTRNFAGAHRAALAGFRAWPHPGAPGERADLARAWRWAGYEERALPLLAEPIDAESAWLRDYRVRREVAPYVYATAERSEDRDALVLRAAVLGGGWHPRAGATAELQGRTLTLRDAHDGMDGRQLLATLRWRVGEAEAPGGTWWPSVALRVSQIEGWQTWAPTVRLTGIPRDHWRVDLEATRELVEAPRALASRVQVDVASIGVEHRPPAPWQLSAAAAIARFDDGTQRLRLSTRAAWRVVSRPRVWAGAEGLWLDRLQGHPATDRGYWNPLRYHEARAFVALEQEWRPFELQGRLAYGSSRELDGSGRWSRGSPHMWELGLGWDLRPALRLRLAAGGSGADLGLGGGGTGYWRRYLNLSANLWF